MSDSPSLSDRIESLRNALHDGPENEIVKNNLPYVAIALIDRLGELKEQDIVPTESTPTPASKSSPWMARVMFLSLIVNLIVIPVGFLTMKTHQDQKLIAQDLVTVERRTQVLKGSTNRMPIHERFGQIWEELRELQEIMQSDVLHRHWSQYHLDEMNRIRLVSAKTDTDGDGVVDTQDDCPTIPDGGYKWESGNLDVRPALTGCPASYYTDADSDGVSDLEDKCPTEPGHSEDWWTSDRHWLFTETMPDYLATNSYRPAFKVLAEFYGCPDADNDYIVDKIDMCPDKGTWRGDDLNHDGCKDKTTDLSQAPHQVPTWQQVAGEGRIETVDGVIKVTYPMRKKVGDTVIDWNMKCEAETEGEVVKSLSKCHAIR